MSQETKENQDDKQKKQGSQGEDQNQQPKKGKGGSGLPEWVTFEFGLAVLLLILGLLTYFKFTGEQGPAYVRAVPQVQQVQPGQSGFVLPVW